MRKQFTVCRYSLFSWLSSTKITIIFMYFILSYQLFIKPYIEFSRQIESPLGAFEPFLIMSSVPYSASLFPLLSVILLSDIPMIDASGKFVIYRTGKTCWFSGQLLFIITVTFSLELFILIFSLLTVNIGSFFANGWSLVVRRAVTEDSNIISAFTLDGTITNQIRPFQLIVLTFTMNILHTLVIGLIQYCFAIFGKRVIGVLVNIALIGSGLCLWHFNIQYKWFLPLSHSLYTGHYDIFFNKTYCDIRLSFLYFFVLIATLLIIAYISTKRSSFHNIEVVDQ